MDKLFQSKWFIKVISLVLAITLYIFVTIETNIQQNESPIIPGMTNEVQVLEDVPLDIRIDADQYVVSGVPEHVTVSLEGKASVIAPIVRQRNFTVFVDLRDLDEGEHIVDIEYENLPDNLKAYIEPKSLDVAIERRATRDFAVDVEFVNLDNLPVGYELGEVEVIPNTVTIVSSEAVIDQIAMVKVYIDVTDLKESIRNREVPISVYDIQGNDLKVRVEPASVTVSVPVDRPSKTVPLTIATKGKLKEGFEIDSMEAPKEIELFGKREILNEVNGLSTKELDVSKIDKSGEYEVDLDFPEGVVANDETTKVKVNLVQSKVFEDLHIDAKGQGNKMVTFVNPDHSRVDVMASGSDTLIRDLVKKDIAATIDVTALKEGKHKVNVQVSGPKDIKFDPKRTQVTIEID